MFVQFEELLATLRSKRWANLAVVNLRILIGFAFLPAGLKKVLHQPFTDASNSGVFHEFLHVFYATGFFYFFVGAVQLLAAVLLMTQRFATVGGLIALPTLAAIMAFCWSTKVYPTASVATLMFLATVGLLLWDLQKWRGVFALDSKTTRLVIPALDPVIDDKLWQACGAGIFVLYLCVCAVSGGVYRPRGVEFNNPAFYLLPAIALLPMITFFVDRARHRRTRD